MHLPKPASAAGFLFAGRKVALGVRVLPLQGTKRDDDHPCSSAAGSRLWLMMAGRCATKWGAAEGFAVAAKTEPRDTYDFCHNFLELLSEIIIMQRRWGR